MLSDIRGFRPNRLLRTSSIFQTPTAATAKACRELSDASPFIEIDEIRHGDDVGSMGMAVLLFLFLEHWRYEIVPAQFRDESIPDDQVAPVQPPSLFITPFENFFVTAASKHALTQLVIFHAQKIRARAIRRSRFAQIRQVILAQ